MCVRVCREREVCVHVCECVHVCVYRMALALMDQLMSSAHTEILQAHLITRMLVGAQQGEVAQGTQMHSEVQTAHRAVPATVAAQPALVSSLPRRPGTGERVLPEGRSLQIWSGMQVGPPCEGTGISFALLAQRLPKTLRHGKNVCVHIDISA